MIPGLPPLVLLETVTLGSDASSVTLPASGTIAGHANFPAGSKHVVCIWQGRSTTATTGDQGTNINVNGDTGAGKYDLQRLDGVNTSGTLLAYWESGTTWSNLAAHTGDNQDAGFFSPGSLIIPHAFGTDNFTGVVAANGIGEQRVRFGMGQWEDTAAITSVLFTPSSDNWKAGSSFSLYVVDESYLVSSGEQIISGSAAAFNDVDVPSQVGDISIVSYLRSSYAATADNIMLDVNADAAQDYYARQLLYGLDGGTAQASQAVYGRQIGGANGNNADGNHFAPGLTSLSAFDDGNYDCHVLHLGGHRSVTAAGGLAMLSSLNRTHGTKAITKVNLTPANSSTWEIGSGMWVYAVPKTLLQRQVVSGSAAADITFTLSGLTIPSTTTDLRLHIYAQKNASSAVDIDLELNSDSTAANYDYVRMYGAVSTATADASAANQRVSGMPGTDSQGNASANKGFGGGTILFKDYASDSKHKHYLSSYGTAERAALMLSGRWESTDAIATIKLTPNAGSFSIGSIFELEAIHGSLGWAGTVNGLANPAKVMGVERENIEKVMGVSSA